MTSALLRVKLRCRYSGYLFATSLKDRGEREELPVIVIKAIRPVFYFWCNKKPAVWLSTRLFGFLYASQNFILKSYTTVTTHFQTVSSSSAVNRTRSSVQVGRLIDTTCRCDNMVAVMPKKNLATSLVLPKCWKLGKSTSPFFRRYNARSILRAQRSTFETRR